MPVEQAIDEELASLQLRLEHIRLSQDKICDKIRDISHQYHELMVQNSDLLSEVVAQLRQVTATLRTLVRLYKST